MQTNGLAIYLFMEAHVALIATGKKEKSNEITAFDVSDQI